MNDYEDKVQAAAEAIRESDAILIVAGAGMGVDSGLPDFRSQDGFWREYPQLKRLGKSFEDCANPKFFRENPAQAWGFYGHRQNLYRTTKPHYGFYLLLQAVQATGAHSFVLTSNVDEQFQATGFDPEMMYEVHGSIFKLQCSKPCSVEVWPLQNPGVKVDLDTLTAREPLPKCPRCGGLARPNILMFSDTRWVPGIYKEQQKRFIEFAARCSGKRTAIIEVGVGIAIPTLRYMTSVLGCAPGSTIIRINTRESDIGPPHIGLAVGALQGIRDVARAIYLYPRKNMG